MEGKIANWARTFGKDVDLQTFLSNVYAYMHTDWSDNPIHPTHLTEDEKKIKQLRKRIRNAKKETTKAKLREEIRVIQQEELK